ncbi:MAG TPA: hypothetical protein PK098_12255 [Phycisphaerales bacterium]|nr:hypothetical protein [Phycisphaerales bacterium]
MFRVLLVLVGIGAVGAFLSWLTPEGFLDASLKMVVGTDAMIVFILVFFGLLQWASNRLPQTEEDRATSHPAADRRKLG